MFSIVSCVGDANVLRGLVPSQESAGTEACCLENWHCAVRQFSELSRLEEIISFHHKAS